MLSPAMCAAARGACEVKVDRASLRRAAPLSLRDPHPPPAAARALGLTRSELPSPAGHDARYLHYVCPTGMIFIPCKDGISHNPAESITPAMPRSARECSPSSLGGSPTNDGDRPQRGVGLHGERSLTMPTISEHLADFAAARSGRARARAAVLRMALYALDTLAVTLAGTVRHRAAPVPAPCSPPAESRKRPSWAAGRVTSAWDAALANGAFAHALELDDDHRVAVCIRAPSWCRPRLPSPRPKTAPGPSFCARCCRLRGRVPPRRGFPRQPVLSWLASRPRLAARLRHGRGGRQPPWGSTATLSCGHWGLPAPRPWVDRMAGGRLLDQATASGPRGPCGSSPPALRVKALPDPPPFSRVRVVLPGFLVPASRFTWKL